MSERPHDLASQDSGASRVTGKTLTVASSIVKNRRPSLFERSSFDSPTVGRVCSASAAVIRRQGSVGVER